MITEIIEIYNKQFDLYKEIYNMLKKFDKDEFIVSEYEIELQNIDFILQCIKKLNDRAEQLKEIYVTKKNIVDFTGDEIKRVESEEIYKELKGAVDKLSSMILSIKKLQDRIISRMNREVNVVNKIIKEANKNKKPVEYLKYFRNYM